MNRVDRPAEFDRLPLVGILTWAPYLLVTGQILSGPGELDVSSLLPYLLLVALLVVLGISTELREGTAQERWLSRDRWILLSVFVGTAMLPPLLTSVVDAEVTAFSGVIGLMLFIMSVLLRRPLNVLACGWVVVVWVGTLAWSGERGVGLVLVGLAAVTVAFVGDAVARQLVRAADREREARLQAASSAHLLETLLGVRSLDVRGVAQAVVDAVQHQGYLGAAVRRLDHQRARAPCLAAQGDIDPSPIGLDHRTLAQLAEPTVAEPDDASTLLLPLRDGQALTGLLEVRLASPADRAVVWSELRVLVHRAEAALERARAHERDRHDVAELAELEQRTNDLISTVSHELRTPVTVIGGLSETLDERWGQLDSEVRGTLLGRIEASATRLDAILRALIDTGAVEHGRLRPELRDTELGPLVVEVVDRLAELLSAHQVSVRTGSDVRAMIDPALFEHVVENLLLNVARHTPAGTTAVVTVERPPDDGIVLTVSDDGPGIAPEDLPHVFERFFRGGAPDRRQPGGLGLGLAFAQQVVRAHGGELTVADGTPAGGARFVVRLPDAGDS